LNCGSQNDFRKSLLCESCKQLRNSGYSDWVLSHIAQDENYPANAYLEDDSKELLSSTGILPELILNRGAALFWRYAQAKWTYAGDSWTQALQGLSAVDPKTLEQKPTPLGIQKWAVGSVTLAEFEVTDRH
jgi:hypothetical protein